MAEKERKIKMSITTFISIVALIFSCMVFFKEYMLPADVNTILGSATLQATKTSKISYAICDITFINKGYAIDIVENIIFKVKNADSEITLYPILEINSAKLMEAVGKPHASNIDSVFSMLPLLEKIPERKNLFFQPKGNNNLILNKGKYIFELWVKLNSEKQIKLLDSFSEEINANRLKRLQNGTREGFINYGDSSSIKF